MIRQNHLFNNGVMIDHVFFSLQDDEDDVFESPVHSDVDEVDSDFDRPEEDDEPISDDENEWKEGRRKAKGYKVIGNCSYLSF